MNLQTSEKNQGCYKFALDVLGDERGSLISIEEFRTIPFEIKRVYYIYGTKTGIARGKHAHTRLKQVLIAVSGQCAVRIDDGFDKNEYLLNSPDTALFVGENLWREMYNFSKDCVLLVLANDFYDENEYIRDYDKFLSTVQKIKIGTNYNKRPNSND